MTIKINPEPTKGYYKAEIKNLIQSNPNKNADFVTDILAEYLFKEVSLRTKKDKAELANKETIINGLEKQLNNRAAEDVQATNSLDQAIEANQKLHKELIRKDTQVGTLIDIVSSLT